MYEILSLTSFKIVLFKKWRKHVILIKGCVTCSTRNIAILVVVVVQLLSCFQPFVTLRTAAHRTSQSFTTSGVFPNSCPSSRWWHPTISSSVSPFSSCLSLSQHQGLFYWVAPLHQVAKNIGPKYWSFSFSICPSSECSGLISFRMDWFDLAVQGTLKSLLQYHSSKASIFQHSAFFMVQLSHPYMTTRKTITLTVWTFVSKFKYAVL